MTRQPSEARERPSSAGLVDVCAHRRHQRGVGGEAGVGQCRSGITVEVRTEAGSIHAPEKLIGLGAGELDRGVELLDAAIARTGERDRDAPLILEAESCTAGVFALTRLPEAWRRLGRFRELPGSTAAQRRLLAQVVVRELSSDQTTSGEVRRMSRLADGDGALIRDNLHDTTHDARRLNPLRP